MTLTPLAVAALVLLLERPMHPYEMFQTLVLRQEDHNVKVRPGSLYHAVDRMAVDGLVAVVGTDRAGKRPERTTYRITDAGEQAVGAWIRQALRTPVNEYPAFRLAIGEAHNLPAHEAVALLGERIAVLREDDAQLVAALAEVGDKGVDERFWIDIPYERALLAAEIEWLATLSERIASGDLPWPGLPRRTPTL